ncbi:MAG: hypothetical protein ACE5GV_11855 [Candidatus Scalindua sp.]
MTAIKSSSNKRVSERLVLALQITIPGQEGETINISSTGVYFEVITDDIEAFSPGTIIPIQIKTSATTPGFEPRDINLKGRGYVVRNDIKNVTVHGNRMGVALEFKEKLDLKMV